MVESDWSRHRGVGLADEVVAEVPRTRLVTMLLSSQARTVCICAPSGYGKTTLMRQWAEWDDRRVVEVTRSGPVVDAAVIAEVLLETLLAENMVSADTTLPSATDTLTWHLKVLPALDTILAGLGAPVLVVIDDATDLRGEAWEALVDSLAHHLPPGSTVCVLTRAEVPRSFRQQRMHGTELEVGADLLAFDLVETEQLFHGMGVAVSGDRLHQLWDWAEGWPAVLYLSGLALRDGRAMQSAAPSSPDTVRDFLRDNVLDSLDPEIADVAMKCSLLEEIDGPLAVAITGRSDAEALLRTLSKPLGLIRSQNPDATVFRMHSLLRTVLSDELHAASVQTWRDTHVAACRALAAAGDLDAAVGHAVAADSDEDLKRIVWPLAVDLLTSGRAPVVRRWLDAAGPERVAAIPELAVSAAWSEQHEGDLAAMARYTALAERVCMQQQCEHLHLPLLRASMAVDGVADMERTSQSLVARMDPADPAFPTALYHLGAARVLLKRIDDAVALLEASRRMSELLDQHAIHAIAASELGIARLQAGDRRGGLDALVEARHVLHHHQMDTALVAVIPYAASAYGYALEGRSDEARDHLNLAVRLVSRVRGSAPWFVVRAILQLARAALSTGDAARARDLVRMAEKEYGAGNACPANDELLADLRQAIQDVDDLPDLPESLTMAEMRVMQYLPTHLSFPDIANELQLSRFTVKTQALAIYRKLGVHSRHEAVSRARTIGLIPPV